MKHNFILSALLAFGSMFFVASCSKDEPIHVVEITPPPPPPPDSNATVDQNTFALVVNNWLYSETERQFISQFQDFFENKNISGKRVKVYVDVSYPGQGNAYSILISDGSFKTYGGELWSKISDTSLNIYFKPSNGNYMPFENLKIKVVIE